MVAKDWAHADGVHLASWHAALARRHAMGTRSGPVSGVSGLVDGTAEGILYGGCLSILVASLGTPYEISTAGTILFLEDVAAKPYQIDRMLMQLKLAGKFNDVRGIIFGEMRDCVQNPKSRIHAARGHAAHRRRFGNSSCVRLALWPRDYRKYHVAHRRACWIDRAVIAR